MTSTKPQCPDFELPAAAIAPRQRRSLKTLHKLLDAAEVLLENHRFEEITIADIVAEAGSSVGSFYARFPTKDALLIALLQRYHQQGMAEVAALQSSAAWPGLDLEERARQFVQGMVQGCRQRRGLLQLRLRNRMAPGATTLPDDQERGRGAVRQFLELFRPVDHEIMHDDKDAALAFALRVINSAVASAILLDDTSQSFGEISDETLIEQLVVVFTSYLRGS